MSVLQRAQSCAIFALVLAWATTALAQQTLPAPPNPAPTQAPAPADPNRATKPSRSRLAGNEYVNPSPRVTDWTARPTFAIAPRTIGVIYGPHYFVRQAYAGPSKRGHAYNVRRKTS